VPGFCASSILVVTTLATTLAPPPEPAAPGGYWTISEQRERRGEPPDGDDELTIGGVLFSLGLLRSGAAGLTVWLARSPSRCPTPELGGCGPLELYGWAGFGEGGLMVGTGLTYLIIGGVRRSRHARWQRGERVRLSPPSPASLELGAARLQVGPWMISAPVHRSPGFEGPSGFGTVGGGAQLRLRF
jgi:hypothetical protein